MTAFCAVNGASRWRIAPTPNADAAKKAPAMACVSCRGEIGGGEAYRLVTSADRPWCERCAFTHLSEYPPLAIGDGTVPVVVPVTGFAQPINFASRAAALLARDGKLAALGGDR